MGKEMAKEIPSFDFLGTGIGAGIGLLRGLLTEDPAKRQRTAMEDAYKYQQQLYADQYNRSMETITGARRRDLSTMWNQYQMGEGATNAAAAGGRGQFGKANNQTFATFANATDSMTGKYLDTITNMKDSYSDNLRNSAIQHTKELGMLPAEQPWYTRALDGAMGGASAGFQVDKGRYDSMYGDYLKDLMGKGTTPSKTTDPGKKVDDVVTPENNYASDPASNYNINNWQPDISNKYSNPNLLISDKLPGSGKSNNIGFFNSPNWMNFLLTPRLWR
jgi:hypothetical protein